MWAGSYTFENSAVHGCLCLHMLNTEDVTCMVGSFDRVQINIETNVYNDLLLPLSNRQLAVQPSSSKKSKKNSCVECLTFREPRLQS